MSVRLAAVELPAGIDAATAFAGGPAWDPHGFWLDAGPSATAGWSWIGIGVPESEPDRIPAVVCANDDAQAVDVTAWPAGPFRGGWVGWLGYEDAAQRAGAPISPTNDPSARWLRVDRFVAFDHVTERAWAIAPRAEIEVFAALTRGWADAATTAIPSPSASVAAASRHTPDAYAALIERCRNAIRDGDAYQLCLTTRFTVAGTHEPAAVFARLRAATPSHHGALIRHDRVALASASPEQFLTVRDGVVRTRPIKGTRPRGATPAEDRALAEELQASPKERAENVMIVDLMRNDLSRVCVTGSVAVEGLLQIESYPAVHQLVSTVTGRLQPGTTVGELLTATFPAGSMTGAPKLSAMTILHELEGAPRGVFAGTFGWIGDDGALDLAMVIRSIVVEADAAYVGAGGGITWGSQAADEVAEVGVKARGPLAALGAALPPGW